LLLLWSAEKPISYNSKVRRRKRSLVGRHMKKRGGGKHVTILDSVDMQIESGADERRGVGEGQHRIGRAGPGQKLVKKAPCSADYSAGVSQTSGSVGSWGPAMRICGLGGAGLEIFRRH